MADSRAQVSALLLSGGESRRLGGEAKALLNVRGEPALQRMMRIVTSEGIGPVAIVVPPDPSPVEALARALTSNVVRSERSRRGRTASVQEGIRALPQELDVLLWPVDHSFVQAGTVHELVAARSMDPLGRWFIPKWQGHGGHPVLIGHELFPSIRSLEDERPLRDVLDRIGPQVVSVRVDDPAVAEPIDTWEAYRRACDRPRSPGEGLWTGG